MTLSLEKSRSPDFDLFSDQEEYSEKEVVETMAKTMEQYMSKNRVDYGLGISSPKIKDKDSFELKGQFLKKLPDNTFSGAASCWLRNKPSSSITTWEDLKTKFLSKYCPPGCTTKKIEEINNFQQEPDENIYQACERFKELLMKCPQYYLTEIKEVVLFYNGLDVPTRQIIDLKGAIPSKTVADAKVAIQEMAEYSQKWHNRTLRTRRASISVMPLSTYLNLGLGELTHTKLTVKLTDWTMKYLKGIAKNVLVVLEDMDAYRNEGMDYVIFGEPFLREVGINAKWFEVMITIHNGNEEVTYQMMRSHPRERMELDLEARLMGETLVLNRSLDPLFRDYIELNDLNVPLELKIDQVDDLMPTIEEGEVVEEFGARNDARMVIKFFGYPSDCDHDKKIRIDCTYYLKFSCMTEYKGNNVFGALMNIPIFVGALSVLTDFAVLEDMDAHRDEGMGNVIFGEPFLREVGINAKWFEGMITIHNGNEEVT
nr:hypothetical protein [Tanacetum cinerariifolium]